MLRFLCLGFFTVLLALSGIAQAANVNFNGGTVSNCTRNGTTYNCTTAFIGDNDTAVIANGYTVVVNGSIQLAWAQGLQMSGSSRLEATGNINLIASNNLNIAGGTIQAGGDYLIGGNNSSTTANIIATTVSNNGQAHTIRGSVTATGSVSFATSTTVTGAVSGASLSTGSSNAIGGAVNVTGNINLGSSTTITGAVSGASITTGSNNAIGGALSVTGAIRLGSSTSVTGAVSGASIVADADASLGSTLTVSGAIDLASRVIVNGAVSGDSIVTNSNVQLRNTLTINRSITLSSGNTITGAVRGASITTDSGTTINSTLTISGAITLGSSNTVNGNVEGNTLTLKADNTKINGNATITGNVLMESGTSINGDLRGYDVRTNASNVRITGNAAVNTLYLGYSASVGKVITCTGPGGKDCNCVTRENQWDFTSQHTCGGAAPPAGAHHFQITHTGSALTCQPQTVKVTACANANCTAPNFTGSSTVTLQPGGKSFTFTGETTTATVEQTSAGSAILNTNATGTTCVNTANASAPNQCLMTFDDSGLQVSVANHIAMKNANVTIQALTASADKQSCVPLLKDKQVNVDLSCAFVDPVAANARSDAKVSINSKSFSCGVGATSVPFTFNASGLATTTLTYQEVGQVTLSAMYSASGSGSFNARGAGNFIAAPAGFVIEATKPNNSSLKIIPGTDITASSAVFALAGEDFNVRAWAVNDKGEVTTNFGSEKNPHNIQVTPAITNPTDSANLGTVTPGALNTLTRGVWTSNAWRFDDVGIITLTATLLGNNGNYLGYAAPDNTFKTKGEQKVGRFIPAYFQTALPAVAAQGAILTPGQVPFGTASGLLMPCRTSSNSPLLLSPCAQGFIYSGQPFYVVVKAFNVANKPTLNYKGALVRNIVLSAKAANGGATALATGAMPVIVQSFDFNQGVGLSTLSPVFNFTTAPNARTGTDPTQFFLRAIDGDNVTSLRSSASDSVEQAITAVSGRVLVPNVYGSPTSSMPVTVQAQFYDGTRGGFLFNPVYNAPANAAPDITLKDAISYSNCQNALAEPGTNNCIAAAANLQLLAPDNPGFSLGKASFRLQAPTPRQNGAGSVTITLKSSKNGEWIKYLPSTSGTATFGIYRSGPVIYTREVY